MFDKQKAKIRDHRHVQSARQAHQQTKQKVQHHYFRIMPDKRWHRQTIWSVFWVVAAIILVQLIYPPNRVLPTATLLGQPKVWTSEAQLVAEMHQLFDRTKIKLVSGNESVEIPIKNFGAEPDTAAMSQAVTDYPFWQRYVPLSILLRQPQVDNLTLTYTNLVSQAACNKYAKQLSSQPVNARIAIENQQLVATDEQAGRSVEAGKLCRQIQGQQLSLGETTAMEVEAKLIDPETTSADLADVRVQAEAALGSTTQFSYQGKNYQPDQPTVAGWLKISGSSDQPKLSLDRERVKHYLETINREIGQPAGSTSVTIVNGVEISRNVGHKGRVIDYNAVIDAAAGQLLDGQPVEPIEIKLTDVAPALVYNSRYTNSEEGLKAYVADAARQYNAHISIRQLNGEGWQAAARQNESIPSASTYKLYVAMWLFDEMAAGRTSWDSPILGTTVSDCFNQMTIASTNPCSVEWLAQFGRENMNQYVYSKGFSHGTTFTHPLATHSTAQDLTNYMVRLAEGSLYADVYRQRLYHSLGTHPYRYGIPTGSAGQVYDKVGFLWDYVHDAAIVNHPKGRYVMTIMTKGQSYGRIASITREVERIMYGN